MDIRVGDLPGIGKKVSFITAEDQKIVLVIHHTGKRELYFFADLDEEDPEFTMDLTGEETRQLGAQLLGAAYQTVDMDRMKLFRKKMVLEWVTLSPVSPFSGKTIAEGQIRKRTGVTILGIIRGEDTIVSPPADTELRAGDTLMVAGANEQVVSFEAFCRGEEE
ncbi:cation:proton antiporter regulatory subunit [Desmospora activa]|uniref:Potassium/proton antiporter regulatory subunit (CPA2 family) n=1 Tax=Desmospora activa DSM 45169 TaxID=1121389 RepID=A0A2T4Z442_9BACL|nr:cation:proton antiporter regulatory subunit [Desmospora activa]PTM56625.1 potassium/proton antiporter regulatory subunit (CPA2 family) [Desmospora activa DSM 45169]